MEATVGWIHTMSGNNHERVRARRGWGQPARWRALLLTLQVLLAACGGTATSTPRPLTGGAASPTPTGVVTVPGTPTRAATVSPVGSSSRGATPTGSPTPLTVRVPANASATALTEDRTLLAPAGFTVRVFAAGLGRARFLAWSPEGDLVVSDLNGRVLIVPARDPVSAPVAPVVFAQGLQNPHGLAFHDGYLYVAETTRVTRFAWQGGRPAAGAPEVVIPDLPAGGHATRTIGFGPDGKLYLSIGSSCNVCVETDPRRATIMQFDPDGRNGRVFARGLRNAVGFVWRPGTTELWATNNGRDYLGDDQPPETINLVRDGDNFGWPACVNGTMPDPQFGSPTSCANVTRPAVEMQAHSAPLGLAFYTGGMFPAAYRGDLFVAFHGSWNRSAPTGYQLVRVRFDPTGRPTGQVEPFVTGWLQPDGSAWGRPVDPSVGPDGALYLSDDTRGVIYRISYGR